MGLISFLQLFCLQWGNNYGNILKRVCLGIVPWHMELFSHLFLPFFFFCVCVCIKLHQM